MLTTHKIVIDHDRLVAVYFADIPVPFIWSCHPGSDATLEHKYTLSTRPTDGYDPDNNATINEDVAIAEPYPAKWLTWQRTAGVEDSLLYIQSEEAPIIFDLEANDYIADFELDNTATTILVKRNQEISLSSLIKHPRPDLFSVRNADGVEIPGRLYIAADLDNSLTVTVYPPNDPDGVAITVYFQER